MFQAEAGLTFKVWRQRARIVLAIDQLSATASNLEGRGRCRLQQHHGILVCLPNGYASLLFSCTMYELLSGAHCASFAAPFVQAATALRPIQRLNAA
jgi:hypothetical protein